MLVNSEHSCLPAGFWSSSYFLLTTSNHSLAAKWVRSYSLSQPFYYGYLRIKLPFHSVTNSYLFVWVGLRWYVLEPVKTNVGTCIGIAEYLRHEENLCQLNGKKVPMFLKSAGYVYVASSDGTFSCWHPHMPRHIKDEVCSHHASWFPLQHPVPWVVLENRGWNTMMQEWAIKSLNKAWSIYKLQLNCITQNFFYRINLSLNPRLEHQVSVEQVLVWWRNIFLEKSGRTLCCLYNEQ